MVQADHQKKFAWKRSLAEILGFVCQGFVALCESTFQRLPNRYLDSPTLQV